MSEDDENGAQSAHGMQRMANGEQQAANENGNKLLKSVNRIYCRHSSHAIIQWRRENAIQIAPMTTAASLLCPGRL